MLVKARLLVRVALLFLICIHGLRYVPAFRSSADLPRCNSKGEDDVRLAEIRVPVESLIEMKRIGAIAFAIFVNCAN